MEHDTWVEHTFPLAGPLVYIAAPYTKFDPAINVNRVVEVADRLARRGFIPIIPHLNHLWHLISPKPYSFWLRYDISLLLRCDILLRIEGESNGADKEVALAYSSGLRVYFKEEDLYEDEPGRDTRDEERKGE